MNQEDNYKAIKKRLDVQHFIDTQPKSAPFHCHEDYEIFVFISGDTDFYVESIRYQPQRGQIMIINDRESHRADYHGKIPYERYAIHFDHKPIRDLCTPQTNLLACFQNRKIGCDNMVFVNEEQLETVIELAEKLFHVFTRPSFGHDVLTLSYLTELLVLINDGFHLHKPDLSPAPSAFIAKVMQYMECHLEEDMTIAGLARHFSIDHYYLSHLFKKETGLTIHHYILLKKIAIAKEVLAQGASVSHACTQAGFNDYTNFIRTFKKLTGCTPHKFRR